MTSRPVSGNFASKSVAMEKPLDQQARVLAVFEQAVSPDCGLLRSKPRCSGGMASSAPYSLTNSRGSGTGVAKTDVSSGNARVRVLRRDGFIMAFFFCGWRQLLPQRLISLPTLRDRDLPYNSYFPMYYLFILARVKGRPPSNGSDQDSQAVAEEKWPVRTTTKTCVRDQAVILRGRDHIHDIDSDLMVNPFLDCGAGVSRSVDEKNQPQS